MDKLTHFIPQTRVTEKVRNTFDELARKEKRKLGNYMQIIFEEMVENYIERGCVFKRKNSNESIH